MDITKQQWQELYEAEVFFPNNKGGISLPDTITDLYHWLRLNTDFREVFEDEFSAKVTARIGQDVFSGSAPDLAGALVFCILAIREFQKKGSKK